MKDSFQILIQELKLLSDYISTNLEAFQKVKLQNYLLKYSRLLKNSIRLPNPFSLRLI